MKSIMVTYADFQALPKGLKQMLLASEEFFFEEARADAREVASGSTACRTAQDRAGVLALAPEIFNRALDCRLVGRRVEWRASYGR